MFHPQTIGLRQHLFHTPLGRVQDGHVLDVYGGSRDIHPSRDFLTSCVTPHAALDYRAIWRTPVTPRTPPRIRTGNLRLLKPTPLPVGLEGH